MKTSSAGLRALTLEEGKRNKMYIDSYGNPTIGVGHLIKSNEAYLKTITLTDTQINDLLKKDVIDAENAVNSLGLDLKQNEFDALVSLTFNIGVGGFEGSNLADYITSNLRSVWNFLNIKQLFLNWYSHGLLTSRRTREYEMFANNKYRLS